MHHSLHIYKSNRRSYREDSRIRENFYKAGATNATIQSVIVLLCSHSLSLAVDTSISTTRMYITIRHTIPYISYNIVIYIINFGRRIGLEDDGRCLYHR